MTINHQNEYIVPPTPAGTDLLLLGRLRLLDGSLPLIDQIASVNIKVANPERIVTHEYNPDPGDVFSETLKTDAPWQNRDSIGYNIAWILPAEARPLAVEYIVQMMVTSSDNLRQALIWRVPSTPILTESPE